MAAQQPERRAVPPVGREAEQRQRREVAGPQQGPRVQVWPRGNQPKKQRQGCEAYNDPMSSGSSHDSVARVLAGALLGHTVHSRGTLNPPIA